MVTLEAGILIVLLMAACILAAWIFGGRERKPSVRELQTRMDAHRLGQSWRSRENRRR